MKNTVEQKTNHTIDDLLAIVDNGEAWQGTSAICKEIAKSVLAASVPQQPKIWHAYFPQSMKE